MEGLLKYMLRKQEANLCSAGDGWFLQPATGSTCRKPGHGQPSCERVAAAGRTGRDGPSTAPPHPLPLKQFARETQASLGLSAACRPHLLDFLFISAAPAACHAKHKRRKQLSRLSAAYTYVRAPRGLPPTSVQSQPLQPTLRLA